MIVSTALIVAIAGLATPVMLERFRDDTTASAVYETVALLQQARALAVAQRADVRWSVAFADNVATLHRGDVRADESLPAELSVELPDSLSHSGDDTVVFQRRTGQPLAARSLTLAVEGDDPWTITVNARGFVAYGQ